MKHMGALVILACLLGTSCITVNVPLSGGDGEPADRWFLAWPRPEPSGPLMGGSLRVKEFGASSDYSLSGMALRCENGTLAEAPGHRWASRLPLMLSEMLSRDLAASGVFSSVFVHATGVQDQLVVEGFVREFGATRNGDGVWTAVLDIDVSLLGDRGTTVLLHRNYRLERAMEAEGVPEMVRQLNVLGEIWSETARGDIISALLPRR